ncbi:MAG: tRNA (adenosine(37)-N6)-threonylcarbamoyltransferase complex dimerization subunit type 1 TsaB [Clostridiales bacterium]|nr:tRNA (adenosine(37)-N6)-threonylcarbamoyltransferase complex dimerization subunit type 1 TsaB [Clostridiales bacterium]
MNYLAIDTSGKNLTVIICKDGQKLVLHDAECGVNHSVELMPKLEQLAISVGFDFSRADFFACVVGAGSFTGIRIGVATVKAMCFAFNKPCLSITSFDTLAYNEKGKVLAVIDAKHNGFYVCGYDNGKVIFEPSYIMREQLERISEDYLLVAIDGIDGFKVKVVSVAQGLINAIENKLDCVSSDIETLSPLYVRKSQAEEGR